MQNKFVSLFATNVMIGNSHDPDLDQRAAEWSKTRGPFPELSNLLARFANEYLTACGFPATQLRCDLMGVMRYRKGEYIHLHAHPGSEVTVVYYPVTGGVGASLNAPIHQSPESGDLVIVDPRGANALRENRYATTYSVTPVPGMVVCMPSCVYHQSTPHGGDTVRVAINAHFSRG